MANTYEELRAEQRAHALSIAKWVGFGVMGFICLMMAMCSFKTVEPGYRGVRVSLGTIEDKSLPPGLYFVNPFTTHIHAMNVQTARWTAQTSAQTNDSQTVTVDFVLNYNLEPSAAHVIYQTVGEDWGGTLIGQVVLDQIKSVVGKHEAIKLPGEWNDASREIERLIREGLAPKHVLVTGFQLTNLSFTPEFHRSIEAKVIAQQRAIEEQNRTVQIQQQANQTVITAKAAAESMTIRANALASNPKLVEWEAVQHWDGHLPTYMLGGATPFINVTPKP